MRAVLRFTPLTQTDSVLAYSAASHIIIQPIYAHVGTAFIPSCGKRKKGLRLSSSIMWQLPIGAGMLAWYYATGPVET